MDLADALAGFGACTGPGALRAAVSQLQVYQERSSFSSYVSAIGRKIAPATAAMACVVALASVVVSFPDGLARHLGFPMTFVTYYSFPETQVEPLGLWQRSAINPLRFWVNALSYYCAFRLVGWFWRRIRTV